MVRAVVAPGIWRQGKEAALIEFISAGERTVGGKKKKKSRNTNPVAGRSAVKATEQDIFCFLGPLQGVRRRETHRQNTQRVVDRESEANGLRSG